jgi:hypothetical protein
MERAGLINEVKIKMDEFTPDGVDLPFDDYIGPTLDECAREILEKAPLFLLTPVAIPLTGVIYKDEKAYIPVPTNYLKLYEVKYPLWKKSVRRAMSTQDPEYKIQENEYIKAGYNRPVVAIVNTSLTGGAAANYLECAKVVDTGSGTPVALYVKTDKPENLNEILSDSLSWLCTSKLLGIMGYADKAKLAYEQFTSSFEGVATT